MNVEEKRQTIRKIIDTANTQFISVSFIKKDGSERVMNCHPTHIRAHIQEEISESAQRAVETRKANHPNLYNVWDVAANGARSINLDTVYRVKACGVEYLFDIDKEEDKSSVDV